MISPQVGAILVLVFKATVLLAVAAGTYAFMVRRTSAATRHMVLTVAAVGLLALPVLSAVLPAYGIPVPAGVNAARFLPRIAPADATREVRAEPVSRADGPAAIQSSRQLESTLTRGREAHAWLTPAVLLLGLYAAGMLVLLIRLVAGRLVLQRMARDSVPMLEGEWVQLLNTLKRSAGVSGPVALLRSELPVMPMTWGTRRPVILLPASAESWPVDRRQAVLLHELSHIARRDCRSQTFSAMACVVYWFHPGVWWLTRRLRVERELACDDRVLAAGMRAGDYARHLLEIARAHSAPRFATALALVRPSQLETRMRAVLDDARKRSSPAAHARVMVAATAIVLLTGLSGAQARVIAGEKVVTDPAREVAAVPAAPVIPEGSVTAGDTVPRVTIADPDISEAASHRTTASAPLVVRSSADGQLQVGYAAGSRDIVNVQGGDLAELLATGLPGVNADAAIRLRQGGITAKYITEVLSTGLPGITVETILWLRRANITAEYITGVMATGLDEVTVDAVIALRRTAVMPDYIEAVIATGLAEFTTDDVIALRRSAVVAEYIHDVMSTGLAGITVDAIIRLRRAAVTPAYISGILSAGLGELTVDEIIRLRHAGVGDA